MAALHPDWVAVFAKAGWQRREGILRWNAEWPDFLLYVKDFAQAPVDLPLWPCGEVAIAPPAPVVFVESRENPKLGLKANSLKVHGIGVAREAVGTSVTLRNLDIVHLPRQALSSASFRLLASIAWETVSLDTLAIWSPFVDTVLTRVVGGVPQPLGKRSVKVRKHLMLADLRPTLVAADSVHVDAYDLSAEGKVRLELENKGQEAVTESIRIVLFEDLDGDFAFDPVRETRLGEVELRGLAAGEQVTLAMRLSGKVRFPGKTFLALIDADHSVVESEEGNNTLASQGICAGFTAPSFEADAAVDHPLVEAARQAGRVFTVGVLTDDNGDGVLDEADHPVLVTVQGGEVEAVDLVSGNPRWSLTLPARITPQAARLLDLQGTGRPSIALGDAIVSATGGLQLDATPCPASALEWSLDFNGDRIAESLSCEDGHFTVRDGFGGELLKGKDVVIILADLQGRKALCWDAVLAYPRVRRSGEGAWSLTVRVGNTGGEALPPGLSVRVEDVSGQTLAVGRTVGSLQPDAEADITLNLRDLPPGKRIKVHLDGENRYFEGREDNNTLNVEL